MVAIDKGRTDVNTNGVTKNRRDAADVSLPVCLTPREVDVLRLLARGCTYARAADYLGISPHTIAAYIKSSYQKLEVHSAGAAIMRAVELGILKLADPGRDGVGAPVER